MEKMALGELLNWCIENNIPSTPDKLISVGNLVKHCTPPDKNLIQRVEWLKTNCSWSNSNHPTINGKYVFGRCARCVKKSNLGAKCECGGYYNNVPLSLSD